MQLRNASKADIEFLEKHKVLVEEFEEKVSNKGDEIDEEQEQDWYSLTLGWALAKGFDADGAHDFARIIRYSTDLG